MERLKERRRYLEWTAGAATGVSKTNAAPVKSTMLESAGRAFHHKALVSVGLAQLDDEEDEEEEEVELQFEEEISFGAGGTDDLEAWEKKVRRKRKGLKEGAPGYWDFYHMLGLESLRVKATPEEVESAYKRANLRLHPDKCGIGAATEEQRERIEARYKLIQDAYDVLSDPARRRLHDSCDMPDAKLVMALEAGDDFYGEFGPGFRSLERFSEKHPVPQLGDANTPYALVDAFYDFWFAFKSWREFPHPDEEDSEVADHREQKREIERKNKKLREEAKKGETKSINAFVQAAYAHDPRVIAATAAAKAAKEQKKSARGAGKREQEEAAKAAAEAAAKAEAEAAEKAKAEAEGAKKNKEAQRKAMQKEKKRLRTAAEAAIASGKLASGTNDVETLCTELAELAQISSLAAALEGKAGDVGAQVELLTAQLEKLESGYRAKAAAAAAKAGEAKPAAAKAAAPFGGAEVALLQKLMKKFPLGTAKRWEVIADELGTGRTGDEVAAFVKTRLASAPMKEGDDFQNFLASRKGTGEVLAEGGASTRESSFSDVQLDLWSSEEDLKLVAAMKAHPKGEGGTDAARWAAIAADVGGHTPAQCVKRVAALKAKLAK